MHMKNVYTVYALYIYTTFLLSIRYLVMLGKAMIMQLKSTYIGTNSSKICGQEVQ